MILGIYGAGGMGRETLDLARQVNRKSRRWDEFVFIDDAPGPMLQGIERWFFPAALDRLGSMDIVISVGEPDARRMLFDKTVAAGFSLATLIHPDIFVPESTLVGVGSQIFPGVFVSCDVRIGDNVLLQANCSLAHDSAVGAHSVLSSFAALGGGSVVGSGVYVGLHCAVREKARIGDDSIVGMGAAVVGDIPGDVVAYGNPARVVRRNDGRGVFK